MSGELATLQPVEAGAPLTAVQLRSRLATIQAVMRDVMQKDADYGVIPGTDKPSLFKPGAEKLCVTFRLSAGAPTIEAVPEYGGDIRYRVMLPVLASDGVVLAVGVGECSTGEEKYRWRRPVHQNEYDRAPEDQRRQKFTRAGDVWLQVRVNPPDVANTVLKMAHKRAYVHAVIMATAAGAIFTQDVEDLPEGVAGSEASPAPAAVRAPIQPPQRKSQTSAGKVAGAATLVHARVDEVTRRDGNTNGKAWSMFFVTTLDGKRYATFDTAHAEVARQAIQLEANVEIAFTEGQKGLQMQAITIVDAPEPGSNG